MASPNLAVGISISLAVAYPTKSLDNFGVTIQYFGIDAFNEQLIGVAYGRKLLDILSIGAQFDYVQVRIPRYGKKSTFTAELGLISKPSDRVIVGFHVYNIFDIEWVESETLPTVFTLGVRYEPTDKVMVMGEVEKVSDFRENFKVGVGYQIHPQFDVRIGFNTNPSLISFGIGYRLNNGFSFDMATTVHRDLGLSPLGGISYQLKN